ncbi:SDR family oxidoreductase [Chitinimonas sp. PSY-7]|uniref:DoxX-like family protein n=1 Tax=Chitinimonas sp. PSY-7 TaxID=3459088 RepID=UPI0040401BBC
MKILLTGASGLIGDALLAKLLAAGHTVHALCRKSPAQVLNGVSWLAVDLATLHSPDDWLPMLEGVTTVVNCAGIFRETRPGELAAIHAEMPAALFEACIKAGVNRVIQVSSLGAAPGAITEYWRSKAVGDAALMQTELDWAIVRPSLVYADEGNSSVLFRRMAVWPVLFVPADAGLVQPIHINDLASLLLQLVETQHVGQRVIAAVGPHTLTWTDYLQALRTGMGLPTAKVVALPAGIMQGLVRWAPAELLSPESLLMLRQGSYTSDTVWTASIAPTRFTHPALLPQAQLANWLPIARLVLAWLWIFTAWVSYSQWQTGLALLAQMGLSVAWQPVALWAGIGVDTLMGLLTLFWPNRLLWLGQIGLIVGYTAIVSLYLPEWWLHPFGPISKNLPVLLVLGLLHSMQSRKAGM